MANLGDRPREAVIDLRGFNFKGKAEVQTIGGCELTEYNTYDRKENMVFKRSAAKFSRKGMRYTFPKFSYTIITLKK